MHRDTQLIRSIRAIRGLLSVAVAFAAILEASWSAAADGPSFLTIDSVVLRPLVEAEAPARQTGVLAQIDVTEGSTVRTNDLLVKLDPRVAELAMRQAEYESAQAEAIARNRLSVEYADKALEVARAELKRSEESNKQFQNSISKSQLDVERLTIEKLELERQQAEHELALADFDLQIKRNALEAARLELELHVVRAPFSGVVTMIRAHVGEWVQPGTPVLRLVAIDVLRAEGFAPADAAGSLLGAEARFTLAANEDDPDAKPMDFVGRVGFVSPEIDPVTRQVRIWVQIDNRDGHFLPGQQGKLVIPRTP